MWGTLKLETTGVVTHRFIPTHVGNTGFRGPPAAPCSVHPHACGEHGATLRAKQCNQGSSPRMWGTPYVCKVNLILSRFIPTHVGNTGVIWALSDHGSVHPHACGEHRGLIIRYYISTGSSPRMWGTRFTIIRVTDLKRFIPTHVGNT